MYIAKNMHHWGQNLLVLGYVKMFVLYAGQCDQMSFWKNRPKCSPPKKSSVTSLIFRKLPTVNNSPIGENSPNLVTLMLLGWTFVRKLFGPNGDSHKRLGIAAIRVRHQNVCKNQRLESLHGWQDYRLNTMRCSHHNLICFVIVCSKYDLQR
jgi:hypothetical protein